MRPDQELSSREIKVTVRIKGREYEIVVFVEKTDMGIEVYKINFKNGTFIFISNRRQLRKHQALKNHVPKMHVIQDVQYQTYKISDYIRSISEPIFDYLDKGTTFSV